MDLGFIIVSLMGWAGIAYAGWSWVIRKEMEETIDDLISENNALKRTNDMLLKYKM